MEDFKRISIIGMGLIGGSIALALKKADFSGFIRGQDISIETLREAKKLGAIDAYTTCLVDAVQESDLVIIATPMGYYESIFKEIAPYLSSDTLVTDVGSAKKYPMMLAEAIFPKPIQFIGGHPMAGSERTGIQAASPTLFENAYYFITPKEGDADENTEKFKLLIQRLGAYPIVIDSGSHDHITALISHIPHLMAGLLVNLLDRSDETSYLSYAGGGFRDTTRIASGNPWMWKDILFMNKDEVIRGIEELEYDLRAFKMSLDLEEHESIMNTLSRAKEIRDHIPKRMKGAIPGVFEIVLDVQDRPGILGEITHVMGNNKINIKEIEIVHAREGKNGAVRLGFSTVQDQKKALAIFREAKYSVSCHEEEK